MANVTQTPSRAQTAKSKKRGLKKSKLIRINRYRCVKLKGVAFWSTNLRSVVE